MAGEEVEEPPPLVAGDLFEWDGIHCPPPVSAVLPPPKTPWSMVAIRNHEKHGSNDPAMVFPPIDHENLHTPPSPPATPGRITYIGDVNPRILFSDYDSDADSNSPSDSSPAPLSPSPPATPGRITYIGDVNQQMLFSDYDSDADSNSSSTFSPSDSSPEPLSPLVPADPAARRLGSWSEILNSKVSDLMQFFGSTSSRRVFFTFRSATFTALLIASLYFGRTDEIEGRRKEQGSVDWDHQRKRRENQINRWIKCRR